MDTVRFATNGTSGICERFLEALPEASGAEYVAAYSRDAARARAFGEKYGARLFFDDLSELAASDEVDAVYIASPNGAHASQALAMIAGGKHVLVEKALASNEREARDVFDAAREAGVVVLEAMRNLHVPTFAAIERTVGSELGAVRHGPGRVCKVPTRVGRLGARAGRARRARTPAPRGGREPCGALILRRAGACGGEGALLGYCSTFYEKKKRLSPAK